jgi:hypothetical protein
LRRRIRVPIELLNDMSQAELGTALAGIQGYPDIRAAAETGSFDAQSILRRADEGDEIARDWLGM